VVEILAEHDGRTEVGWDYQFVRFREDLNLKSVAEGVAKHTLRALGAKSIPSGAYTFILHPRVVTQLLDLVEEAVSAEAVQLGRSFWAGKKGVPVASAKLNLIDDPEWPRGLACSSYDDEGVPHEKLNVVANGVLQDYFYDLSSASKAKRESNGRAVKAALGSIPKPGATNFFIAPGKGKLDSFLEAAPKVFYLHDVMGLHMADPITGEFSLGASGELYEKGRFSQAVRGVTVAGTIGALLKNISEVGSELSWYGAVGAPPLLVQQMTVAGA
jgi:PmbA protein